MSQFHAVFRGNYCWERLISIRPPRSAADGGAQGLFLSLVTFGREQALLGAARRFLFCGGSGDACSFSAALPFDRRFDLIQ